MANKLSLEDIKRARKTKIPKHTKPIGRLGKIAKHVKPIGKASDSFGIPKHKALKKKY